MYKVVRRTDVGLVSPVATGNASVTYVPGRPARAPDWLAERGYHPVAFNSRERALAFILADDVEVWEAEARGILERLPDFLSTDDLRIAQIVRANDWWPPGTVMALELTLRRRV